MKITVKPNTEVIAAAVELTRQPEATLSRTVVVQIADLDLRYEKFQMRVNMSKSHIDDDLIPKIQDGTELLPVRVVRLPSGVLVLVDGFHRIVAYNKLEILGVDAEIIDGDENRAFEEALKANNEHGLPLSPADKLNKLQKAVEHWRDALSKGEMSYQELAKRTNLSTSFVHEHVSKMGVVPEGKRLVKRGDSFYLMDTEKIGKKRTASNSGESSPKSEAPITLKLAPGLGQQLRWLAQEFEPGELRDALLSQIPEGK